MNNIDFVQFVLAVYDHGFLSEGKCFYCGIQVHLDHHVLHLDGCLYVTLERLAQSMHAVLRREAQVQQDDAELAAIVAQAHGHPWGSFMHRLAARQFNAKIQDMIQHVKDE